MRCRGSHRSPDLIRRTSAMLLSCGDALVDFLPVKSADGRDAAVPVVGGSCLNIAVGMASLGAPAGFVGGVRDVYKSPTMDEETVMTSYNRRTFVRSSAAAAALVASGVSGRAGAQGEGGASQDHGSELGEAAAADFAALDLGGENFETIFLERFVHGLDPLFDGLNVDV